MVCIETADKPLTNEKLKDIISKGPKYQEPKPFSLKYNFKLIMDSVEDFARRWAKQEKEETSSLSTFPTCQATYHLHRRICFSVSSIR